MVVSNHQSSLDLLGTALPHRLTHRSLPHTCPTPRRDDGGAPRPLRPHRQPAHGHLWGGCRTPHTCPTRPTRPTRAPHVPHNPAGMMEVLPDRCVPIAKRELLYMGGYGAGVAHPTRAPHLPHMPHNPPGMMEVLPDRCVPIAKRELLYMGAVGVVCWLGGIIFIDRKRTHDAISTMAEAAHTMLSQDVRVWVFPEGTRNHSGSMLPFKRGAFHLAVQAQVCGAAVGRCGAAVGQQEPPQPHPAPQVPVVPIVISSYQHFYSKRERRFTAGEGCGARGDVGHSRMCGAR
uniref:1-acylglycerol-3-phosphate O-acyltransferase n=1 Tax=Cyanoderma ruficeps TaxID=181631 RepID=A0A8C3QNB2_9PASS